MECDYSEVSSATKLPAISGAELLRDPIQHFAYGSIVECCSPRFRKVVGRSRLQHSNLFSMSRQTVNNLEYGIASVPNSIQRDHRKWTVKDILFIVLQCPRKHIDHVPVRFPSECRICVT